MFPQMKDNAGDPSTNYFSISISKVSVKVLMAMAETSNVEKPNKCNQCYYATSLVGNLTKHLKIHSGEKSHKCTQCEFASAHANSLRTHLKIHRGEKSNKCNQCDYASLHASNLRKHLETHSGEK